MYAGTTPRPVIPMAMPVIAITPEPMVWPMAMLSTSLKPSTFFRFCSELCIFFHFSSTNLSIDFSVLPCYHANALKHKAIITASARSVNRLRTIFLADREAAQKKK